MKRNYRGRHGVFFHTEVNFEILGYFISIRCLFPDQSWENVQNTQIGILRHFVYIFMENTVWNLAARFLYNNFFLIVKTRNLLECVRMMCVLVHSFFLPDKAYSNNFYTKRTSAKRDQGEQKAPSWLNNDCITKFPLCFLWLLWKQLFWVPS